MDLVGRLVLAALAAIALAFLAAVARVKGLYSAELASWVQGFGTIAAIVASVAGAAWLQDRQRHLEQQAKGLAQLEALLMVAITATRALRAASDQCARGTWTEDLASFAELQLEADLETLKVIEIGHLPNRNARAKLADIRVGVLAACHKIGQLRRNDQLQERTSDAFGFPLKALGDAVDYLETIAPARG